MLKHKQSHDIFHVVIGLLFLISILSWLAFKSEGRVLFYIFTIIALLSVYISWMRLAIGGYIDKEIKPLFIKYGPFIVILPIFIINVFTLWIGGLIGFNINLKIEDIIKYTFMFLVVSYILWIYGYSLTMRACTRKKESAYLLKVITLGSILFATIAEILIKGPIITGIASALIVVLSAFAIMRIFSSGGFEVLWGPLFISALIAFEIAQIDAGRGLYLLEVMLFGKGGTAGAIVAGSIVTGAISAVASNKI